MSKMKSIKTNNIGDFYDLQVERMLWGSAQGMSDAIEREQQKDEAMDKPVDKNLKTLAAMNKPRLSDVPPVALFALGAAMSNGKDKYGRFNWRETGTTASVFYDAMVRHLADWYSGEDYAHDSKIHHLGHIMASCAILLDSELHKNLNDDREIRGQVSRSPENWMEVK
jgi:hypothetical protein